jgi:NTP pyrophosphatase (non-canonical NTP hydrolase)
VAQAPDYAALVTGLRRYRDDRDWGQFHTPKDLAIAVSTEASELLEHFLWRDAAAITDHLARARTDVLHEIADVTIYLVYLCDALGADLVDVAASKLEINLERHHVDAARGRSRPERRTR